MISTLRFLAAVPALLAASVMPATASASVPGRTLFHHSATASVKPQYVLVEFRNTSGQQRALQLGGDTFPLAAYSHTRLRVIPGTDVKVRSEVNSKVDGTSLTTVTAAMDHEQILVN